MPLTAGWSKRNYFNKAWQGALAQTLHTSHNCTIKITKTDDTPTQDFDPATGKTTYPPDAVTVLYEGTARVQPRGASFEKSNYAADTSIRRVQFQVPLALTEDVRPGSIIRVLECELYPNMTTLDYRTQGIVNSGNPIEITLYAMVDQEVIVGD